jgi:flavin reductase (DIM6/NTAB) family NADH-FMN oxidoreductase RutF
MLTAQGLSFSIRYRNGPKPPENPAMTDKYRPLKDAFGRFATGIAIATCRGREGRLTALTINSFTSVSLAPSLVLWCIENRAAAFADFMAAESYGVSVLHSDQQSFSERFAHFQDNGLKEDEVEFWSTGAPILKDRLAGFDCRITARHKAGDHVILIGEVVRYDSMQGDPLVYYASNYYKGAGS